MVHLQIFGGSSILGEGNLGELSSAILVDGVEAIAGWITVFIVDRVGRRVLLIPGCGMGAATLIAAGIVLKYETIGRLTLATGSAAVTVILVIPCPHLQVILVVRIIIFGGQSQCGHIVSSGI